MSDTTIALDLEGVLAETHVPVVKYSDQLTLEDFEEFGFDDDVFDHFMDVLEGVWEWHWKDIPPAEPSISEYVNELRWDYTVDLVTNTPGDRERVLQWCEMHEIEVDGYVFPGPGTHKEDLDYDIYIDDNPYLFGEVPLLYFMTTPWNRDTEEDIGRDLPDIDDDVVYYDLTQKDPMVLNSIHDGRNTVVRVDSLEQVLADLTHRRVEGATAI